jgi:hypothetical protein
MDASGTPTRASLPTGETMLFKVVGSQLEVIYHSSAGKTSARFDLPAGAGDGTGGGTGGDGTGGGTGSGACTWDGPSGGCRDPSSPLDCTFGCCPAARPFYCLSNDTCYASEEQASSACAQLGDYCNQCRTAGTASGMSRASTPSRRLTTTGNPGRVLVQCGDTPQPLEDEALTVAGFTKWDNYFARERYDFSLDRGVPAGWWDYKVPGQAAPDFNANSARDRWETFIGLICGNDVTSFLARQVAPHGLCAALGLAGGIPGAICEGIVLPWNLFCGYQGAKITATSTYDSWWNSYVVTVTSSHPTLGGQQATVTATGGRPIPHATLSYPTCPAGTGGGGGGGGGVSDPCGVAGSWTLQCPQQTCGSATVPQQQGSFSISDGVAASGGKLTGTVGIFGLAEFNPATCGLTIPSLPLPGTVCPASPQAVITLRNGQGSGRIPFVQGNETACECSALLPSPCTFTRAP